MISFLPKVGRGRGTFIHKRYAKAGSWWGRVQ